MPAALKKHGRLCHLAASVSRLEMFDPEVVPTGTIKSVDGVTGGFLSTSQQLLTVLEQNLSICCLQLQWETTQMTLDRVKGLQEKLRTCCDLRSVHFWQPSTSRHKGLADAAGARLGRASITVVVRLLYWIRSVVQGR